MIINAKGFVFFERIEFYWQLGLSLSSNLLYFYQNGKHILMGVSTNTFAKEANL